jgi:hypothetical protein
VSPDHLQAPPVPVFAAVSNQELGTDPAIGCTDPEPCNTRQDDAARRDGRGLPAIVTNVKPRITRVIQP